MNTPPIPKALSPPLVVKATLLLAEFCLVKVPTRRDGPDAELLALHAARAAILRKQPLSNPGWFHGGLND
jgi:hypothetical protein